MCDHNEDGECDSDSIDLEHKMTGGGLILMCQQDTDRP